MCPRDKFSRKKLLYVAMSERKIIFGYLRARGMTCTPVHFLTQGTRPTEFSRLVNAKCVNNVNDNGYLLHTAFDVVKSADKRLWLQ